jgi:hypothetical protein
VRKYAVESRLSDRDFKAFCGVIRGRRNTIDMAHAWLSKRGYDISRGAVWKFSKALRERRTGLDTLTAEGRLPNHALTWIALGECDSFLKPRDGYDIHDGIAC